MATTALILMSKIAGAAPVKTRLAKQLGQALAEELYQAFLQDIAHKVQALPVDLLISYTPQQADLEPFRTIFGEHCTFMPQAGADLGQRMSQAFQTAFARHYSQVILIGGDSPDLPPAQMLAAIQALTDHEMAIIPTQDGGYCLIGFSAAGFCPAVFDLSSWGETSVYAQTCQIANQEQLKLWQGPLWQDLDDLDDLNAFYARHQATSPDNDWFVDSQSLKLVKAYYASVK